MSEFPIRSRRADHALDPGRIGYDLDADHLLLHTIQSAGAFDTLRTTGTLSPDAATPEPLLADAYEWMHRQMSARLPTRGDHAVWLWARTRRTTLTTLCRSARGQVLLTCRIPRERVLLSHFDEWHMVLNRHPVTPHVRGDSENDSLARWEDAVDALDRRLLAAGVGSAPVRDWPAALRDEIEQSWENIFARSNYGPFEVWQATTHTLHDEDVVEATRIIA